MKHISYVLKDEYENLLLQKKELEYQYKEQSKRKREACEQWAETRHDNADYEDAEYQQSILGRRISDLNSIIQNTKLLIIENIDTEKVRIWSTVQLLINNQEFRYTIWWYPTIPWRMSYMSPLWKLLIGKKEWISLEFIHENTKKNIIILSIT